jgi:hypothetical protein
LPERFVRAKCWAGAVGEQQQRWTSTVMIQSVTAAYTCHRQPAVVKVLLVVASLTAEMDMHLALSKCSLSPCTGHEQSAPAHTVGWNIDCCRTSDKGQGRAARRCWKCFRRMFALLFDQSPEHEK